MPSRGVAVRVAGGALWGGAAHVAPEISVGVAWAPRRAVVAVPVASAAAAQPAPPSAPAPPTPPAAPDGPRWLGAPACRWSDGDAAAAAIRALEGTTPASAADEVDAEEPASEARSSAGGFVVMAMPGDEVYVDGVQVVVGPDGVASVVGDAEALDVEVRGGGRAAVMRVYPSTGVGLWRRVPDPVSRELFFASGSATLDAPSLASLRDAAAATGGWSWELAGWYSPEGQLAANISLAQQRAVAVRDALIAAGVPSDRLHILEVGLGPDGRDPAAMRAVQLTPVAPSAGGAP